MKRTKIVCTIGPASEKKEVLMDMAQAGMNVARLNFSHGNHEEHQIRIDRIKEIRELIDEPIAIILDTKGPEIRLGDLDAEAYNLELGDEFILSTKDILGNNKRASVSYEGLASDVEIGTQILIDDGLVELVVTNIEDGEIYTEVLNSGEIKSYKGVNVPNTEINLPALTEKDINDLLFGIKNDVDFVAASFIRKAEDIKGIREVLDENGGEDIQIIAKIESREGVDNLSEILEITDGIMVARGDLGVQLRPEEIPLIQKNMIRKCNKVGKPVITATQMLDSMTRNPRATRAEVTDVANAILDGSDAVMLSGETAAGKYPVLAVQTMANIAKSVENAEYPNKHYREYDIKNTTNAISKATCEIAEKLDAKAIVTATISGTTARFVSKFRPYQPIIAVTPTEKIQRQVGLSWGVFPRVCPPSHNTDEVFERAVYTAIDSQIVDNGDLVILTAGIPVGIAGTTNTLKVHVIGDILLKGDGIGNGTYIGKAKKITDSLNFKDFNEGDILIAEYTDTEHIELIKKAGAIIVERGGLTSHAAIAGLSLGILTIVGAKNALNLIKDNEEITVDAFSGVVYKGRANVL